ncbi:hypothetical protein CspeluHIS016_0401900 [Cutaneotrichosporon spelunceum]|uniref:Inositol-pentakisphosphate 2-kinase n=1 Tax=Cutaneotrichosporon spelunceum TaxID=1672016 RepID=A0AAD3TUV9_9TREE|nr:hypothetical protein CspeluHIS016_0401900 [Cutaneotrichosporon spelunceum]
MVSLFSLFSSKKRPKATDRRPTSPTSPKRARSVRNPASSQFKADATRRASSEGGGLAARRLKASAATATLSCTTAQPTTVGRSGQPTAPPRINISLPFEAQAHDNDASLGLDGVGRTPVLTAAERRVLDDQRYTPADLQAVWEWLGPEFATRGAETVGIMLPRRLETSKDRQRQIASLFVLARRPKLADKFPSLTSRYPIVPEDEAADAWKSRLVAVAKDTPNPVDLAEVLKTILRRLVGNARPIIDPATYVRFVQQEHAASYPRVAYATMLEPHLTDEVTGLLAALFEVVAAVAMHADTNSMSAGRLCHLFGWWLLGAMPDGTTSWNGLYEAYRLAGQRAEHLFYARVRWQTTLQKMPRRLVQLILSYPFGESSASSEHLPLPPASTFPRRVLHVTLGTDSTLPTGTAPAKALGDALIAKLDSDVTAPTWVSIRGEDLDAVLSADSRQFLAELAAAKGLDFTSPPGSPTRLPDDELQCQTFDGRRRSMSFEIPRLDVAGPESPRRTVFRLSSAINLNPPRASAQSPPQWDDFLQTGFSDTSSAVSDLSLSLKKPTAALRLSAGSAKSASASSGSHLQVPKRRSLPSGKRTTHYVISAEEIVEVEDGFIHFVEDGQLDPVASASWPRFALVQLAQPLQTPPNPDSVDWLLVTVKKREAKRAPSIDEPMPDLRSPYPLRPLSPSTTNTTATSRFSTAFGFSSLASKFRRKSYLAELASHTGPTRSRSLQPITHQQWESRHVTRNSGASDAPTEYTIGETGEMVVIPSPSSSAPISPHSLPPSQMDPVLARSAPTDWVYLGEGGAHVVFRYRGTDPALQGRAMRLVKADGATADAALRHTWAEELLPQFLPASLLASPAPAIVDEKWMRAVVTPTEIMRPAERRAEGKPLAESVDYSRPVQLMDDLTCGVVGEKVLAIEIKPKWGFLPQARHLTPLESIPIKSRNCRFCLHQHYRGESIDGTVYCPIGLYSGDRTRVQKALDGLWAQWHAHSGGKNNLRVYVDGKMVLPLSAELIPTTREGDLAVGTSDFLIPLLEKSGALQQLKQLQSTLDATNISSLARQFSEAKPGVQPFAPEFVSEPTAAELTSFANKYLAEPGAGARADAWTLREREIAFMLSAIFKDCSMVIRAVLRNTGSGYELDEPKSSVKLIDTDLKPLTNMKKWYDLDEKLWRYWAETRGSEEQTVIIPAEPVDSPHHSYRNLTKTVGATLVAAGGVYSIHGSPNPDDSSACSIASIDAANTALASTIPDASPKDHVVGNEVLEPEIHAAPEHLSPEDPERTDGPSIESVTRVLEAPAAIVPAALVPLPANDPAAKAEAVAASHIVETERTESAKPEAAHREVATEVVAEDAEVPEPVCELAAEPMVTVEAEQPTLVQTVTSPATEEQVIPTAEEKATLTAEEKVELTAEEKVNLPAEEKAKPLVEETADVLAEPVMKEVATAPGEPAAAGEEPSSTTNKKAGFAALAATGIAAGAAAAVTVASKDTARSSSTTKATLSPQNVRHWPSSDSLTQPENTLRRKTSDLESKSRVARISSLFNRRASQTTPMSPTKQPKPTPPSKSPKKEKEDGFASRFLKPKKSGVVQMTPTVPIAAAAAATTAGVATVATAAVKDNQDEPETASEVKAEPAAEAVSQVTEEYQIKEAVEVTKTTKTVTEDEVQTTAPDKAEATDVETAKPTSTELAVEPTPEVEPTPAAESEPVPIAKADAPPLPAVTKVEEITETGAPRSAGAIAAKHTVVETTAVSAASAEPVLETSEPAVETTTGSATEATAKPAVDATPALPREAEEQITDVEPVVTPAPEPEVLASDDVPAPTEISVLAEVPTSSSAEVSKVRAVVMEAEESVVAIPAEAETVVSIPAKAEAVSIPAEVSGPAPAEVPKSAELETVSAATTGAPATTGTAHISLAAAPVAQEVVSPELAQLSSSPHTPAMPIRESFSSTENILPASPYSPAQLVGQGSHSAVKATQFPRLSAFGDDLRIASPDLANLRQSPPLHTNSPVLDGPTIVPTKSIESPVESPLRKADTAFPRLSAFIDKDTPGIAALRDLDEPEIPSVPTPIEEESRSLQPSPNVATFAERSAYAKTSPLDAFGITAAAPVLPATGVAPEPEEPVEPASDESQLLAKVTTVDLSSPAKPKEMTPTKLHPTATTPEHVARYQNAALPPLPHMRTMSDTSATESIFDSDAFATAPISPISGTPIISQESFGFTTNETEQPSTPHAAEFE